ncbi:GNAT family N-acetyltransferase [Polaromonas sp. SM01]|uniref:GNAT family N-acetyltransferase n=1 Tax=Polaromonas sp. SM01 TaxID=3085630 RepID=UPI00298200B9|nr:GNAT family N-acetyltransferase [Polaromonas sp. SM01]MDW5443927.1 GNAT family N-acetyltransferase [Polaromonas sp. SM01]
MYIDLPHISMGEVGSLFVLTPEHVTDSYVSWLNTPEINQYLESRFTPHTVESTRAFVASVLASSGNLFLGITSHQLRRHVGNIKLGPIDPHHETGDIGILIGDKTAWGKGIATAAIEAVSAIAATHLKLRKLTAGCYASNVGSRKAFEKAGFLVEGVRPAQFLLDGKAEDLVLMGRFFK